MHTVTSVHKDVTEKLKKTDRELYKKVRQVLEKNKEERHLRGGLATKLKYKNAVKKQTLKR